MPQRLNHPKLAQDLLELGGWQMLEMARRLAGVFRQKGHSDAAADWDRIASIMVVALADLRNGSRSAIPAFSAATRSDAGPRILVTEDDEDVRTLIEDALLDAGYEVDATDTVQTALSLLDGQSYDLLLTDGRLPDGSGLTVAASARRLGTKVLVFTGYAHEFAETELSQYAVVRKPAEMEDLVATVSRVIAPDTKSPAR